MLINAMKKVIENGVNVDLTIAGDGPDKNALEKLTKDLMIESYVKFTGRIQFENLFEMYQNCDIVIFPSIYPSLSAE